MSPDPNELEIVYRSRVRGDCREIAVVLEAAGIGFRTIRDGIDWVIVVHASETRAAYVEIGAYLNENRIEPPQVEHFRYHTGAWIGVCAFVATIVAVDILKVQHVFDIDWVRHGRTDALAIQAGQWWRAITALTLHADAAHLIGNACVGGLFGFFAGQLLGPGLAWLTILLSGSAGNLANGFFREEPHTSIGASTAVFAALGLVASYVWIRRSDLELIRFRRWRPMVGALILFGYFGTGGARTDILAHAWGLVCGIAFGVVLGVTHWRIEKRSNIQLACGVTAFVFLVSGWFVAIR